MSGSRKGSAFERSIAKKLSLWLTNGESKTELIRSVSSGGWKHRGARQGGDLAANGPKGEEFRNTFILELKNRQSFEFKHYFTSGNPELLVWWDKLYEEAVDTKLVPLLVFKRNFVPTLLVMPESLFPSGCVYGKEMTLMHNEVLLLVPLDEALTLSPDKFIKAGERCKNLYF